MAGPDSKRLYLSIVAQNLDNIKSERAYWNKNFISITPSGAGTKYTTLQAAMMLKKMQVVKFLARHPAIDLTVKATDGRTTLMIAAQSSMPVPVLQKILEKYDLKTINECDTLGKTALDLAEPDTETYDFLKSVGCQTKAARDACLQGFFVSAGKAVHQRVRKKGEAAGEGKSSSCPPPDGDKRKFEKDLSRSKSEESNGPGGSCSGGLDSGRFDDGETVTLREEEDEEGVYEEERPWQLFSDPHDLLRVLENYLDTWGDEGEEGELCREWVVYVKKKIKKNAASEAVEKWNRLVVSLYGEENVSEYRGEKNKGTKPPGVGPGTRSCADGSRHESPDKDDNGTTTKDPVDKRSKQRSTQRDDLRHQGKEAAETGESAEETQVERAKTVPESLRGFFNPQSATTADNSSPPPPKPPPEGDRRRTLGVWLDKSDARERFAEVISKRASGGSRRRHKKCGKS